MTGKYMEDKKYFEYLGHKYEFVANATYTMINRYGDVLDPYYDVDEFMHRMEDIGGKVPCPLSFDIRLDVIENVDGKIIIVYENVMGDEEYDLYKLV